MSNSTWRRLLAVINRLPFGVSFRRQDLREPAQEHAGWHRDRYHVLGGDLAAIEWLEISARFEIPRGSTVAPDVRDHSVDLRQALSSANTPFSIENGNVRIWGYMRPGDRRSELLLRPVCAAALSSRSTSPPRFRITSRDRAGPCRWRWHR